ncbi:MAG: hypothetical protein IJ693_07820 [Bacteroidaceae bacterium]|nr:hypothetical protein [Bacteroidaceae bacterium]
MAKLSQCAKCFCDRRVCGHYKQEDDMECPHFCSYKGGDEEDGEDSQKIGIVYASFCILYVYIGFAIGLARYFKDMRIYYVFAIPVIILIVLSVVRYIKKRKERKQMGTIETKTIKSGRDTRTLLQVTLRELNLPYEFDEEQNFIVTYQGETFRILANNDSAYIHIQDLWWYDASLTDIDNLSLVHRAVNDCNIRDTNRIVYTYNREEQRIGIHTLCDILWISQIPNAEQYLQATMNSMLRSHHMFFRLMEDLRREEHERRR